MDIDIIYDQGLIAFYKSALKKIMPRPNYDEVMSATYEDSAAFQNALAQMPQIDLQDTQDMVAFEVNKYCAPLVDTEQTRAMLAAAPVQIYYENPSCLVNTFFSMALREILRRLEADFPVPANRTIGALLHMAPDPQLGLKKVDGIVYLHGMEADGIIMNELRKRQSGPVLPANEFGRPAAGKPKRKLAS